MSLSSVFKPKLSQILKMSLRWRLCIAVILTLFMMSILFKYYRHRSLFLLQINDVYTVTLTFVSKPATVVPTPHSSYRYLPEEEVTKDLLHLNISDLSNPMFSKVYLSHNKTCYSLGEDIQINIQVYNGYGHRKLTGGDYLRLWMEDIASGASVSGDILDHNNGSYTGMLKAVWSGHATIRVFLARHRVEIQFYYKLYRQFSSLWTIYAGFSRGNVSERTECSHDRLRFGVNACNFTDLNHGFAWFCNHPSDPLLRCEDWMTSSSEITRHTETNAEKDIFELSRSPKGYFFTDALEITVCAGMASLKRVMTPVNTCNTMTPETTWARVSPNGYYWNNTWYSLLCSAKLNNSRNTYRECLGNKTLWIPGDSTSYQFYKFLTNIYAEHSEKPPTFTHHPQSFRNDEFNFEIKWLPHEMPFYCGQKPNKRSCNQAEHVILNNLPNTTEDIVVLYLYIHLTLVHPAVFRRHVQQLVFATRGLLKRAPNVTVAVRGPHAFYKSVSVKEGLSSYWGLIYQDILHEEFFPLRSKVVYIDFWDLSVARAFYDIHPPVPVIETMVQNMMSLLCFRK